MGGCSTSNTRPLADTKEKKMEDKILAGAKAMHIVFEQRAERRNPFYTRQKWDAIGEKCQKEFIDWARIVIRGAEEAGN